MEFHLIGYYNQNLWELPPKHLMFHKDSRVQGEGTRAGSQGSGDPGRTLKRQPEINQGY